MNNENTPDKNEVLGVAEMARNLAIILNTSVVYHQRHPVFLRAVSDRWPEIVQVLQASKGSVELIFWEGQVFFNGVSVEPGNTMLKKLTANLNGKGVKGLAWSKNCTQNELIELVDALNNEVGKSSGSLEEALRKRGVKSIREIRQTAVDYSSGEPEKTAAKTEETPKDRSRKTTDSPRAYQSAAAPVFELNMGDFDSNENVSPDKNETSFRREREEADVDQEEDPAVSRIRSQCHQILTDYELGKTTKYQATQVLAEKFKKDLDERTHEIRQQTEAKIKRLENIKDLVMLELEQRALAALVITPNLRVLSMNRSAKELLGDIEWLDVKSSLAASIRSGGDKETLEINGVYRQAHVIISEASERESGTILICLEPC